MVAVVVDFKDRDCQAQSFFAAAKKLLLQCVISFGSKKISLRGAAVVMNPL